MKRTLILLAVLFQFIVLAAMAAEREWITRRGATLYLRTAPVDPRDLFRGDFVRLSYDISVVPLDRLRGGLTEDPYDRGREVYAVLERGPRGLGRVRYVTDTEPDVPLFIRGRLADDWRIRNAGRAVRIKYGIETYFVEQGKGIEMERRRGGRNEVQIPLEMSVAVGPDGTAVLKGHRWSDLGIGLTVVRRPDPEADPDRRSAVLRVTLKNVSPDPLAVVALPDAGAFFLVPTAANRRDWRPARPRPGKTDWSAAEVIVLDPGESWFRDVDLSDPRWHMTAGEGPVEIGTLEGTQTFRLVYRPPTSEAVEGLPHADVLWHGELPSRAFHGRGEID